MTQLTSLSVFINSTEYDLSDRVKYLHINNDGFGIPPVIRFTEEGPLQDGATDLGYRLQPRVMNLTLNLLAKTVTEYWNRRNELLYIFTPRNIPLKLRFTYDIYQDDAWSTKTRQIDCYVTRGPTFTSTEKQGFFNGHRVSVELTAVNPLFYDPNPFTLGYPVNDYINGDGDPEIPIAYLGTYRTYPIITINGPMDNLTITNVATGDKIDFGDYSIPSTLDEPELGIVRIDLRYGYKTVKDDTGANLIDKISPDSDLATFSLEAAPEVADGNNTILMTCDNIDPVYSNVTFTVIDMFIGV